MMDNKLHRDFKRYEHNRYQRKLIGGNSAGNPKHTIKIQRMFCDGSCSVLKTRYRLNSL